MQSHAQVNSQTECRPDSRDSLGQRSGDGDIVQETAKALEHLAAFPIEA